MQQRYYDPQIGRFLSIDPVSADPKTCSNFNRYWYAENNPYANIDPDGRACITSVSSAEMCSRSRMYESLDGDPRISRQTRFFAAASMVTSAFATHMVGQVVDKAVSGGFMFQLSRDLQKHNLQLAGAIRGGSFMPGASSAQRDAAFVHSEQSFVQGRLDQLKADSPDRYGALIQGANNMLNSPAADITDPNFAKALNIASGRVGGALDFANQGHREAIGRAAIEVARSTAQYCTGSHFRRC